MDDIRYQIQLEYDKEAHTYIATMKNFWFVEEADTKTEAIDKILSALIDYSTDYFKEISLHSTAPNLKLQFPYVKKALTYNDIEKLKDYIDVK